jgi:hypothetical protein
MADIIQQLLDLKEWGQNPERYERRLNFRGAGLVQPGPGRPGYSGSRFSPSSSKLRQLKDRTWKYITHDNEHITGEKKSDVVKKMKKRSELSQKKLDIQKKATAKKMAKLKTTYEGAGKHLNKVTAGPGKNIYYRYAPVGGAKKEYNKVKHFKDKTDAQNWVKKAIESTGRITDEKFLELRNSNKAMNNLEFANFLNKETDFKGVRGEKFTAYNVRNRQLSLDVGPTGYSLKFPLSKKEVLDTLGATEDGAAKIKAWKKAGSTEKGFKYLYTRASGLKTYQKAKEEGQFETKAFKEKKKKAQIKYEASGKGKIARLKYLEIRGIFPGGDPELDLWRDLYGSSQTTEPNKRLTLKTKKPTPVVNKQGNKIIPWFTDDNFKKVRFLDNETGRTITFNNLKERLGEEKYNKVLQPYKDKYLIKDTEIMYKGHKRKVATLINEGVFGPIKDFPQEGYFHVHHPAGKGKDPFFTQLTSWDANKAEWRPRTQLLSKVEAAKDFGAKRKVVEEFIENIPEGIQTQPGKKLYGKDVPFSEKLSTAGKEADLLRSKNFRAFLQTAKTAKGPAKFKAIQAIIATVGTAAAASLFDKFGIQTAMADTGAAAPGVTAGDIALGALATAVPKKGRQLWGTALKGAAKVASTVPGILAIEAFAGPGIVSAMGGSFGEAIASPLLLEGTIRDKRIYNQLRKAGYTEDEIQMVKDSVMLRADTGNVGLESSMIPLQEMEHEGKKYTAGSPELANIASLYDKGAEVIAEEDRARLERADKFDYLQDIGFAGGGIANVRRPNAIPPVSGPVPQGGGLSSQFNRVKKLME